MTRPRRRWLPGRAGADTGTLPLALLLTLVGTMLSALLVPLVVNQFTSTRFDATRLRALNAAQAGLDIALGQIRAANDGTGHGRREDLPCGPFSGTVGTGATTRYAVTITYYSDDPRGHDAAWQATHTIACGDGAFTTPAFAVLQAQGTENTGVGTVTTRTLQGTYTFTTTNENIPGGLIHAYKTSTSTDLCLDAGSGTPAAGTNVQMQRCLSGSVQQKFEYQPNLNLVLVHSITATLPGGMCLEAGATHAKGNPVTLQPCATSASTACGYSPCPLPQQQWSINDVANFEGTTDGRSLDGFCFNVQSPDVPGSFVVLGTAGDGKCRRTPYNNEQTFSPEAAVGAGAAGPANNQLVNFNEFGRCLDVTGQQVSSTFLIAWPCKQAPDPANVAWNQKWALPAIHGGSVSGTGTIVTGAPAGAHCLQSPLSTQAGKYVIVVPCPTGNPPAELTWTVWMDTGSYATSYVVVDSAGYCMQATDPDAKPTPDLYGSGTKVSKIVVAICDGSTLQKWNAPANIVPAPPLKDVREQ
jgi:Ricin-type beta-trefoil lectin domain